ncbi:MAG: orotidine-5'-phosphate decarboxylase [Actinomycetota bacterium]
MTPFGDRLAAAMAHHGQVCVGIDPHPALLDAWGLPDNAEGLAKFSEACLIAAGGYVAAVKPQSAFFERHGSRGIAVLETLLADARSAGVLVILDAKRGDIGSTMAAYANAYLNPTSELAADAVTLSPYLGYESLRPALDYAVEQGRGVFVLALTSNREGRAVQHAVGPDGAPVARTIMTGVTADNARSTPQENSSRQPGQVNQALGSIGVVIGATTGSAVTELGLDLVESRAPILAPGIGAQGAGPAELAAVFGPARAQVVASVSRSILNAGPTVSALRGALLRYRDDVSTVLGS